MDLEVLSENGILICHDCLPPNINVACPNFRLGGWCGQTYIAFIDFCFNNPSYFYGLLNTDTGIGIISKNRIENLEQNTWQKTQIFLLHLVNRGNEPYHFFKKYYKNLIKCF